MTKTKIKVENRGLIYDGGETRAFLPGIPARNLTDDEVKRFGGYDALLRSGLYRRPEVRDGRN